MKRIAIICFIIICACNITYAANPTIFTEHPAVFDVDSLGDLWVITLDHTGSMLKRRDLSQGPWAPQYPITCQQLNNEILNKLYNDRHLDTLIDTRHALVAIYTTGYGLIKEDSYGRNFDCAPSLDDSFIHSYLSPSSFRTNSHAGIEKCIRSCMLDEPWYKESFVSQIRALSLKRVIDDCIREGKADSFGKIHIITITDDADANDQWRMDYYSIRQRSKKKMNELNSIHQQYIYNSFTQSGYGLLEEVESFTENSGHVHYYLYDYTTLQQRTSPISCFGDSLIKVSAKDGKYVHVSPQLHQIVGDTVMFFYIDKLLIGDETIFVGKYLTDSLCIKADYSNSLFPHNIFLSGDVQVCYIDSIYGRHYKKYPFTQSSWECPGVLSGVLLILALIIILPLFGWILYIGVIRPYRNVLTCYFNKENYMKIRRGYLFQWNKGNNPILSCNHNNNGTTFIPAKHPCIASSKVVTSVNSSGFLVDSRVELVTSDCRLRICTAADIDEYFSIRTNDYPDILKSVYHTLPISKFYSRYRESENKVMRKLYKKLANLMHIFDPHFYYWVVIPTMPKNAQWSWEFQSDMLPYRQMICNSSFFVGKSSTEQQILYTYFSSTDLSRADVLVSIHDEGDEWYWNAFDLNLLNCHQSLHHVAHLIHFHLPQKDVSQQEANHFVSLLARQFSKKKVCIMHKQLNEGDPAFLVESNTMSCFIHLVENTKDKNAQMIFSPIENFGVKDMTSPIQGTPNSLQVYASLLPFTSIKDMPKASLRLSLDILDISTSRQEQLHVEDNTLSIMNNIYSLK